jgi:DNA-binding ferritin-like protein
MAKQLLKRPGQNSPEAKLISALVSEMFNASTVTHKLHLKVKGVGSHAQHKALNKFYASIKDLADSLAEQYQGHTLMLLELGPAPMEGTVLNSIEECMEFLDKLYALVGKAQKATMCSAIINEMDNIKSLINSTKYKLHFLA